MRGGPARGVSPGEQKGTHYRGGKNHSQKKKKKKKKGRHTSVKMYGGGRKSNGGREASPEKNTLCTKTNPVGILMGGKDFRVPTAAVRKDC